MKQKGKPRVKILGFKAEESLYEPLEKLAKSQDRSTSWVIRQLLIRALEQQEKTA